MANETKEIKKSTIIVCCKLPNGILLELGSEETGDHESVKLAGSAHYQMPSDTRKFKNPELLDGGYSITIVDKDFWDAWEAKHKNFVPLRRGLIFTSANRNEAQAQSRDNAENKTDLEQVKPKSFGVAPLSKSDNPNE